MSEQFWWYLARSSGIVAAVLLVLGVVWGILMTTRLLKPYVGQSWVLEVHRWLGGLTISMIGFHLLGLALDGYVEFGFVQLLVPGTSNFRPLPVALGILAMYLVLAVQLTSVFRRRLPRRVWKVVHVSSYLAVWTALLHAGLAGSDVPSHLYQVVALTMVAVVVGATVLRILVAGRSRELASD